MSRAALAGIVAVAWFAIAAGQASAASVQWGEDWRRGAEVWILAGAGERVDLTLRAEGRAPASPEEIVVENAAGTLTTPGTFAAPGSCDSHDSVCTSACRLEAPNRARCSIFDGYTREPDPVNPYEPPGFSFSGVSLTLSTADDRITVPADNPTRFRLRSEWNGGSKTWNLARVAATLAAYSEGNSITSGSGANVHVGLWGANNTFDADNGRADGAACPFGYPQTIRIDVFDDVDGCTGDVQPHPSPVGTVPAPPDADEELAYESARVRNARRCVESNVAVPGSCTTP